nr:N-alpha-acetyltransferase 35, NatC auxiliary subunit [Tanacetum cinerariifolium]
MLLLQKKHTSYISAVSMAFCSTIHVSVRMLQTSLLGQKDVEFCFLGSANSRCLILGDLVLFPLTALSQPSSLIKSTNKLRDSLLPKDEAKLAIPLLLSHSIVLLSALTPPRAIKRLSWKKAVEYFQKLLHDLDVVYSHPAYLILYFNYYLHVALTMIVNIVWSDDSVSNGNKEEEANDGVPVRGVWYNGGDVANGSVRAGLGHGSNGFWVEQVMDQMVHALRMGQMGHGSNGSGRVRSGRPVT